MTRDEFFTNKENGALWDVGVSINRTNPLPLDSNAVFQSYEEAVTYAKGVLAYPGQFIAVVGASEVSGYLITVAGDEDATLVKLAQTTASGDLAADVAKLQTQVASIITEIGKAATDTTDATGLYKLIAEAKAEAEKRVLSMSGADASVNVSADANKNVTVNVAISADKDNDLSLAPDGLLVKVPEYTLVKDATAVDDNLATYHLTKDGANIGEAINIPKDLVVKYGSVIEAEVGSLPTGVSEAGTYIKLILANSDVPIYIPVGSLIEYVTGGSAATDPIQINVTSDTHKVSASILEASIAKDRLVKSVQDSLDLADSALQKGDITTGASNGSISVEGTDVAVKGLDTAAYKKVEDFDTAGEAAKVKKEVIGSSATDTKDSETIHGAKKYADAKLNDVIGNLDKADAAVDKQFVTAVSETDGVISVSRKALEASDIPNIAISQVTNLQDSLDAKQDNLAFMSNNYNASTNKVATASDITDAKNELIGDANDVSTDDTINGAKVYAKAQADTAYSNAKKYTDDILDGDTGLVKRVGALETKVDVASVSNAIEVARSNAISNAKAYTDTRETAILGEAGYSQTVKSAYELASANKNDISNIKTKITEADALHTVMQTNITKAQETADAKVASVTATTNKGIVIEGAATAPTVGIALDSNVNNKATLTSEGLLVTVPDADKYNLVTDSDSGEYAAVYHLTKNDVNIGAAINIPKNMVIKSGEVITDPDGKTGTYIVLTLANATSDKIYVPVDQLIEYVTSGSSANDAIGITVSDDHKVTAEIRDGSILETKLESKTQQALADVRNLENVYVKKETGKRLMTDAEGTKLEGIEEKAQVNKIESVKVNGTALAISSKEVNIPLVTADLAGLVITATGENQVSFANGVGTVNSLNVQKLV
jgi:hypothetical protein